MQADGYRDAKRVVDLVKRTHPELHLTEDYVNAWAYRLMGQGEVQQAITLFRYNTVQFPRSSNTFDSLGEGYEKLGDSAQAVVSFRKALELDPQNRNSAEHLRKLLEN